MPKQKPPKTEGDAIDERYMEEWVAWGLKELGVLLEKHMAFYQYLVQHHLEE